MALISKSEGLSPGLYSGQLCFDFGKQLSFNEWHDERKPFISNSDSVSGPDHRIPLPGTPDPGQVLFSVVH